MPQARISKAFVRKNALAFLGDLIRARDLYRRIVTHGYSRVGAKAPARLSNPDRRDAAQFIFFEVAAQFEHFARTMFQAEVRSLFAVT